MKRLLTFCASVLLLVATGCDTADTVGPEDAGDTGTAFLTFDGNGEDGSVDLIAGQNYDVGEVTVERSGDNLVIRYLIDSGWCALEYHLDVGTKDGNQLVGIPVNRPGNPQVGRFAYSDDVDCVHEIEVVVPLSEVEGWEEGETVVIAAHAVVSRTEGGDGDEDCDFFYGISRMDGDIYKVSLGDLGDTGDNTATLAYNTTINAPWNPDWPNGLAHDILNGRLYFTNAEAPDGVDNPLYFINTTTGTQTTSGEVIRRNAAAAFAGGSYWYTPQNLNDNLRQVSFDAGGMVVSDDVKCESFLGDGPTPMFFGDYVYDEESGLLYGNAWIGASGTQAYLYTLDPATCEYNQIGATSFGGDSQLLQLTQDCGGNLIGHQAGTGQFFQVDPATAVLTDLGYAGDAQFNDLAPGACDCEPETPTGGTETAWGAGTRFVNQGNWATYFTFTP